jgi:hypothetical protein
VDGAGDVVGGGRSRTAAEDLLRPNTAPEKELHLSVEAMLRDASSHLQRVQAEALAPEGGLFQLRRKRIRRAASTEEGGGGGVPPPFGGVLAPALAPSPGLLLRTG